jgi:hypothetical protein
VRGNKIARVGMRVRGVATLLTVRHNWLLILAGWWSARRWACRRRGGCG